MNFLLKDPLYIHSKGLFFVETYLKTIVSIKTFHLKERLFIDYSK